MVKPLDVAPCRRCGHERSDHVGVFTGPIAQRGCRARRRDDFGWVLGACECAGYEPPAPGESLGDALVASVEELPPLRIVSGGRVDPSG
jgi:hypothetical protein